MEVKKLFSCYVYVYERVFVKLIWKVEIEFKK